MSDKPVVLEIPEELLTDVQAAQVDIQRVVIEALEKEVRRAHSFRQTAEAAPVSSAVSDAGGPMSKTVKALPQAATPQKVPDTDTIRPPIAALEAAIQQSQQRVASGQTKLRILGLHAGNSWIADDFDAPLPDELWGGLFE